MNKWYEHAEEASKLSTYERVNIGAAIVKGNYLVAIGYNQPKTHPRQAELNRVHREYESESHYLHAEVHALISSGREDITGADIYIFRRDRNNKLAMCKPCKVCRAALKAAGISRVYYTNENGYEFYEE